MAFSPEATRAAVLQRALDNLAAHAAACEREAEDARSVIRAIARIASRVTWDVPPSHEDIVNEIIVVLDAADYSIHDVPPEACVTPRDTECFCLARAEEQECPCYPGPIDP